MVSKKRIALSESLSSSRLPVMRLKPQLYTKKYSRRVCILSDMDRPVNGKTVCSRASVVVHTVIWYALQWLKIRGARRWKFRG